MWPHTVPSYPSARAQSCAPVISKMEQGCQVYNLLKPDYSNRFAPIKNYLPDGAKLTPLHQHTHEVRQRGWTTTKRGCCY